MLAELVSGVAHELNNPLTTILGYAQLLPTLEGEDGRRAITTIEQEAQRAGRSVRNLLYFARQHRPRVEPLDLNAVLRRVIDVRLYNFEAGDVRLDVRLAAIPELLSDRYQLEQVFLNLLTNAEQALPAGGAITIESSSDGPIARVTITDTGAGITEALAARIFEPFFSTRDIGAGEGLGLSTAYGIVQAHGGRMAAEQAPSGRAPGGGAGGSGARVSGSHPGLVRVRGCVRSLPAPRRSRRSARARSTSWRWTALGGGGDRAALAAPAAAPAAHHQQRRGATRAARVVIRAAHA